MCRCFAHAWKAPRSGPTLRCASIGAAPAMDGDATWNAPCCRPRRSSVSRSRNIKARMSRKQEAFAYLSDATGMGLDWLEIAMQHGILDLGTSRSSLRVTSDRPSKSRTTRASCEACCSASTASVLLVR